MWPFESQNSSLKSASGSGSGSGSNSKLDLNSSNSKEGEGCPVDHSTRQAWLAQHKASSSNSNSNLNPHSTPSATSKDSDSSSTASAASTFLNFASPSSSTSSTSSSLSTEREVSSIPRLLQDQQQNQSQRRETGSNSNSNSETTSKEQNSNHDTSSNWVYPSPNQFFQAMKRKASQNLYDQPQEEDMPIVVPIHNAVNERAWKQLLEWENLWDSTSNEKCGGVKLVSFIGKPKQKTWRAWGRELMGYQAPFDRHDWLVDRCGHRIRYIIDFYSGKQQANPLATSSTSTSGDDDGKRKEFVSFYLDVRPAPDTLEGWLMRGRKSWKIWTGI